MTMVAVFQYLIGNTDWSVYKRHNIAIFQQVPSPNPCSRFRMISIFPERERTLCDAAGAAHHSVSAQRVLSRLLPAG